MTALLIFEFFFTFRVVKGVVVVLAVVGSAFRNLCSNGASFSPVFHVLGKRSRVVQVFWECHVGGGGGGGGLLRLLLQDCRYLDTSISEELIRVMSRGLNNSYSGVNRK